MPGSVLAALLLGVVPARAVLLVPTFLQEDGRQQLDSNHIQLIIFCSGSSAILLGNELAKQSGRFLGLVDFFLHCILLAIALGIAISLANKWTTKNREELLLLAAALHLSSILR